MSRRSEGWGFREGGVSEGLTPREHRVRERGGSGCWPHRARSTGVRGVCAPVRRGAAASTGLYLHHTQDHITTDTVL